MEKEAQGLMKDAERFLILSNIDRLWKEHLQALKFVQQAVGLRGYAQRDPLIEYKLEGYNLFLEMMAQIRRNVIYSIYQVLYSLTYTQYSFTFFLIHFFFITVSTSDGEEGSRQEVSERETKQASG